MTKTIASSAKLEWSRAADKLSMLEVTPWANSSQTCSTIGGAGAENRTGTGASVT